MDTLLAGLQKIARASAKEFIERGGRIIAGDEELDANDVGSVNGALGPLLWWAYEFTEGVGLAFPFGTYQKEAKALTGYAVCEVPLRENTSNAMTLWMFSDFLRKELMTNQAIEAGLDLTVVIGNFVEFCQKNVPPVHGHPAHRQYPE